MAEGLIVENIIKIDYVLAMITKGKELTPDVYEELRDLLEEISISSKAKDNAIDDLKKEIRRIANHDVLANFCEKISKQEDCPAEFIELVNKEFWNLV